MKRTLLSVAVLALGMAAHAQVITYVYEPPALEGNYDFSYAEWSATPDLLDPINAVLDTVALAYDGTAADSLCCDPLINGSDVNGKIALLYRGSCEFGTKALNAQNEGAVAVIIVTYAEQSPIAMGEGVDGYQVTIPVIMLNRDDGDAIRMAIQGGQTVRMFIGNQLGVYVNNNGVYKQDVLIPPSAGTSTLLAQDGTEFTGQMGGWVRNFGQAMSTGISLKADIYDESNSNVYSETSSPQDIPYNDSVFYTLPDFALTSYSGLYRLEYTILSGSNADEFTSNDTLSMHFLVDSLFTYGDIDPTTRMPYPGSHFRPSGATGGFTSCINFQNANGNRVAATGIWFSSAAASGDSVTGQYIQTQVFEWNDVFTGLGDGAFGFNDLNQIGEGEYTYATDAQQTMVYAPFFAPVQLQNDQRYLFCITSFDNRVFFGYDDHLDYDENVNAYDQPISPEQNDGTWYGLGFGTDVASSMSIGLVMANGIEDLGNGLDIKPYPNPTNSTLRIPLQGLSGKASLSVTDLQGRTVRDMDVTLRQELVMDMSDLSNGTYLFKLTQDDRSTSFRVVVTK
ncbi:MAG: T9SS type A sorting domain-containing protein [Flavobacteriales bacterium]|nr:T9SS type A sorting domain-containing protein [Flavobacteriales bacterium]